MPAFFFDMDGTIIDSRADLAATVNHTRRDLGLSEISQEAVLACVGQGAKYLLAHAIPEPFADAASLPREEITNRLWEIFRSDYAEHMLEHCALYPGVEETLHELARRGCPLGVNTSKPNFATKAILEHFKLDKLFGSAVVAGGDCDEKKPSAKPLLECAARLGHTLTPADWMVGDSWTDLDCAANAGVKGAFCAYGFGSLGESSYALRMESFADLLSVV